MRVYAENNERGLPDANGEITVVHARRTSLIRNTALTVDYAYACSEFRFLWCE
jgi:hypothetical protein